jgi:hypothetical protein
MSMKRAAVLASFAGMILASCQQGAIGDPSNRIATPNNPNNPSNPNNPNQPQEPPNCAEVNVGEAPLRRLTGFEWERSAKAAFQLDTDVGAEFPPDPYVDGFDNSAGAANITQIRAERMLEAAERAANAAVGNLTELLSCPRTNVSEQCAITFIRNYGRKIYRRALTDAEVSRLKLVYDASIPISTNVEERFSLVIQSMLMAPQFNFKIEAGDPGLPSPKSDLIALSGPEIASRLAFLLWSAAPDDELLDSAMAGRLVTKEGIEAEARRMLQDPRAKEGVKNFVGQWLELYRIDTLEKDTSIHPMWNDQLRADLREETERFIEDIYWTQNGGLKELLTSDESIVNASLAKLYGIPGVTEADGWKRVSMPSGQRRGVLTQGSFLSSHAHGQVTSPVRRGLFVRQRFLCQDLPPPPNDVVITVPVPTPDSTNRQRISQHATDDACSGCHRLMDPLGFGFELFDAIGRHQLVEVNGLPVDPRGEVLGTRDMDGPVQDALEMIERLASSDEVQDCAVKQTFRFAQGRRESLADTCVVSNLKKQFEDKNQNLSELLVSMTTSDAFRFRPVVVQ